MQRYLMRLHQEPYLYGLELHATRDELMCPPRHASRKRMTCLGRSEVAVDEQLADPSMPAETH